MWVLQSTPRDIVSLRDLILVTIIRRLLDKVGYGLKCVGHQGKSAKRVRVDQVVNPDDGRFEVCQQWLSASNQLLDISERWQDSSMKLVD